MGWRVVFDDVNRAAKVIAVPDGEEFDIEQIHDYVYDDDDHEDQFEDDECL